MTEKARYTRAGLSSLAIFRLAANSANSLTVQMLSKELPGLVRGLSFKKSSQPRRDITANNVSICFASLLQVLCEELPGLVRGLAFSCEGARSN